MNSEDKIVRPKEEINRVLDWAHDADAEGTRFSGETYEAGILALWGWLTDPNASDPTV